MPYAESSAAPRSKLDGYPAEVSMNKEQALAVFENYKIRRIYDEKSETWFFSAVDIIAALIQQPDYQTARKYWNKLKERLKKEGSQTVINCHQLKMKAADVKEYLTDAADPEKGESGVSGRIMSRRKYKMGFLILLSER
jgi:hypothetical protein